MKYLSFFFAIAATLSLCSDKDTTHNSYIYDSEHQGYQGDFSSTNPYQPPSTHFVAIDTPQDIARERIHQQCESLSRARQWSYPTYSARELSAALCSAWSVNDFARAAEYATCQAMQQGRSPDDVERELLSRYEYYRIPAFRDHIKTFSSYRSHIKKLHARLSAKKVRGYRFFKVLGFLDPNYVHQLDMAEKLNAEIIKEEELEQKVAKQQQRQATLEGQQRELQAQQAIRTRQESVRAIFETQRDELNQLGDEWLYLQDIYQEHDLCDDGRYERRRQALHSVTNDACNYETKSYTISPDVSQLIGNTGNDGELYRTCYGNQIQQVIHQECIDGMERLVCLPETSVVYPYRESIAQCFDAAREYNQAGSVDKATAVTDFCWTLLDCGKAIAQGAIDGVVGGVRDMLEHPVETVLCAVACECVLAYQASKILYNVADIGITYAFDAERAKQQWDEYIAPVTQLIGAISNKELSLRDSLKGATQFAVQWKTQAKLLGGLNKLCKTAKARALEFAKNNPLTLPEQYMTTPEGILLQSTHNVPPSGSSFKYERSSRFFVANQQEISELANKARSLMQPLPEMLQIFGQDSLNTPESFLKHIFAAELREKRFPTGKVTKLLSGFHHYMPEHLDEMNIKLVNPKTCHKTGLIIADVLCDGHLEVKKTFFPTSWSRTKVISKLAEAIRNPTDIPAIEGTKAIVMGKTSEGIIVRIVVDIKSGNYITAYPDRLANDLL